MANNPAVKGGVLFGDSADKAARFIWLSNVFDVPLVFLADVPGFMIGSQVERQGIIRHGAKMITAVSEATAPKVSVIVRKAYGAGLYAMRGPPVRAGRLPRSALGQDRCDGTGGRGERGLLQPDPGHRGRRAAGRLRQRAAPRRYEEDVYLLRLASDLVIDVVVPPEDLRRELVARIGLALGKSRTFTERHNGVPPM